MKIITKAESRAISKSQLAEDLSTTKAPFTVVLLGEIPELLHADAFIVCTKSIKYHGPKKVSVLCSRFKDGETIRNAQQSHPVVRWEGTLTALVEGIEAQSDCTGINALISFVRTHCVDVIGVNMDQLPGAPFGHILDEIVRKKKPEKVSVKRVK